MPVDESNPQSWMNMKQSDGFIDPKSLRLKIMLIITTEVDKHISETTDKNTHQN